MAPFGRANPATGPQDVNLIVLLEKGRLDLKFETALPFDCFLFDPFNVYGLRQFLPLPVRMF